MRTILVVLVLLLAGIANATAGDIQGSADHPLIPRYEGSEIVKYDTEAFTDYRLLVAPAKAYGGLEKNLDSTLALEGALTRITYRAPADRSALEVFRNYETALAEAGFDTVFSCEKEGCGGRNFNHAASPKSAYTAFGEYYADQRYLAARLARPEGDVYAALYVVMNKAGGGPNKNRAMIQLDVIEMEPMEQRMTVVEAGEMERDLAAQGRVAVYGILFDFDKDTIRPESKAQLQEIARLLKESPDLQVFIVGHTDGKGGYEYNLDLSERRARAVVKALGAEYGVAAERLTPVGVGMVAPVATNRTEDGRARNRRVEIVERMAR
ncbi:DUF4892 domain-containing protein [Kaustia mangrovi]|uniref:DUF4892 domain-containing protein n=1 Tax=Kaustia mangrovi TaxID=2593653 RepID=A0A7S8HBR4_9HYPH|nr:OmpA family protein [Kaustia mangrovi]QPC42796.1 DUF4892 domain-containing protein [Kaustia mangrovi]